MKAKWNVWKTVVVILAIIIVAGGSFWGYTKVKGNNDAKTNNELATLQATFVQQYGNQAIIKQLVSPDKVYAALWSDSDNISHVSWNIGGLWVTVFSSGTSIPTP